MSANNKPKKTKSVMITTPTIFVLFVFFLTMPLLSEPLFAIGAGCAEVGFPQLEQNFELSSIFEPQYLQ